MTRQKILIPTDGSEFSLCILPYVARFLRPDTCELLFLYVAEEPEGVYIERPGFEDLTSYPDQMEEAIRYNFRDELEPHLQPLQEAGFATNVEVWFGRPVDALDAFLEQQEVDLIAMTTHGRTGLQQLLYGSIAEHLLHKVTVPLLLYRASEVPPRS